MRRGRDPTIWLGARPGLPLIHSGGIDWRAQPGLAGHKRHKGVMQSINQLESGGSTGGPSLSSSLVGFNADDEVMHSCDVMFHSIASPAGKIARHSRPTVDRRRYSTYIR